MKDTRPSHMRQRTMRYAFAGAVALACASVFFGGGAAQMAYAAENPTHGITTSEAAANSHVGVYIQAKTSSGQQAVEVTAPNTGIAQLGATSDVGVYLAGKEKPSEQVVSGSSNASGSLEAGADANIGIYLEGAPKQNQNVVAGGMNNTGVAEAAADTNVGIYLAGKEKPTENVVAGGMNNTGVAEAAADTNVGIYLAGEEKPTENVVIGGTNSTGIAEAGADANVGIYLEGKDDPTENVVTGGTNSTGVAEAGADANVGIYLEGEKDRDNQVIIGGANDTGILGAEAESNVGIWFGDPEQTFEDEDGDGSVEATTTLGIRLTAPDAYDVTFDTNASDADDFGWTGSDGSTTTSKPMDADSDLGIALSDIPNPTRPGWLFGGWYKDANCTPDQKVTPDDKTPVTDATTLYALWIPKTSVEVPLNVYLTIQQDSSDRFTVSAAAPGKDESAYKLKNSSPVPIKIEGVTVQDTYEDNAKSVLGSQTLDGVKLHVMSTDDAAEEGKIAIAPDDTGKIYQMPVKLESGMGALDLNDPSKWSMYSLAIDRTKADGNGYENADRYIIVPAASYSMKDATNYDTHKGERKVFYGISGFNSSTLNYTGKRLPIAKLIYTIQVDGDPVAAKVTVDHNGNITGMESMD